MEGADSTGILFSDEFCGKLNCTKLVENVLSILQTINLYAVHFTNFHKFYGKQISVKLSFPGKCIKYGNLWFGIANMTFHEFP